MQTANHMKQNEFNRRYGSMQDSERPGAEKGIPINPDELFGRKVREGNLLAFSYISLANYLLHEQSGATAEQARKAQYCFRKAFELMPHDRPVLENLIKLNSALGDTQDNDYLQRAFSYLQQACGGNGKLKLGIRYLAKGNRERAEHYFSQLSSDEQPDVEAMSMLADMHMADSDFEHADKNFERLARHYAQEHPFASFYWGKYGELALAHRRYDKAVWCLDRSVRHRAWPRFLNALAEARFLAGDEPGAAEAWRQSLLRDSLQTPVYFKLYDALFGLRKAAQPDLARYRINILAYTFNKRDMFQRTIEGLARTDIGNARILLLDNNCTDGTGEFLQSVQQLFPGNPVEVISLPINIGAPAARNWLLARPENGNTDFVAYLDDDVVLPRDWLRRLVGTMTAHPKAAIVGTKVINEGQPRSIQYIYRYFDVISPNRLILSSRHPDEVDLGQFDFVRKCLSVMGCCHLLKTDIARDVGEFDIRFSPSQVDDIDHDIRTCLKGHEIIYDGYLEITHCQKSGKEAHMSRPAMGNVLGNDFKFAMKHTPEDMLQLKQRTEEVDRQDLRDKISRLKSHGIIGPGLEVPFDVI